MTPEGRRRLKRIQFSVHPAKYPHQLFWGGRSSKFEITHLNTIKKELLKLAVGDALNTGLPTSHPHFENIRSNLGAKLTNSGKRTRSLIIEGEMWIVRVK